MNRLLGIGAVAAVVVGFLSFKKVDFKLAAEDSNIVVTDRHTGKRWKVVGQKNEGTPLWSKATLTGNVRQNAATYTFGDYGAGWYDRLLKGERQPRHQPPPKLTEEELWTEIWELYVGLYDSPENLYEDGEASPSRVKEKIATFKRKIRMAGKELGRKVSYEQANDWARKNNIGWYGNAEDDNFKLAAEGETDVEQTLSMLGLTVAEVVEQNIAYKSKKSYGTAQVVIDKHTGELYHRIYDKGAGSLGREDYLHNSYGAYASQLKNFNKWVRLINSHSRGGSSGPGGRCVFIVSLLINRETGEVLRSHQGVESKNAESFEARGYEPNKPFYSTTRNYPNLTTIMHPLHCSHHKKIANYGGTNAIWDDAIFYDTIEEMVEDNLALMIDTQWDGITEESEAEYNNLKTIGEARKFLKKGWGFKLDFAPCFRKERDYDSKALNVLPINVRKFECFILLVLFLIPITHIPFDNCIHLL